MRLVIFGAGSHAREIYSLVEAIDPNKLTYTEVCFLDQNNSEDIVIGDQVFKTYSEKDFFSSHQSQDDSFAIGIGSPRITEKIIGRYKGLNFPNLIHPSFICQQTTITMGRGNIICAGNVFTTNICLGDFNCFNLSCTLAHDALIGNGNLFNAGANIAGSVSIGNFNLVGNNATVLQGLSIGDSTVLGAMGLATKNLESGYTYIGIPAKKYQKESS